LQRVRIRFTPDRVEPRAGAGFIPVAARCIGDVDAAGKRPLVSITRVPASIALCGDRANGLDPTAAPLSARSG
jgi:hypothetical protein